MEINLKTQDSVEKKDFDFLEKVEDFFTLAEQDLFTWGCMNLYVKKSPLGDSMVEAPYYRVPWTHREDDFPFSLLKHGDEINPDHVEYFLLRNKGSVKLLDLVTWGDCQQVLRYEDVRQHTEKCERLYTVPRELCYKLKEEEEQVVAVTQEAPKEIPEIKEKTYRDFNAPADVVTGDYPDGFDIGNYILKSRRKM